MEERHAHVREFESLYYPLICRCVDCGEIVVFHAATAQNDQGQPDGIIWIGMSESDHDIYRRVRYTTTDIPDLWATIESLGYRIPKRSDIGQHRYVGTVPVISLKDGQ